MILRKPYAFLIKHFKFIHIILTFLLSYIFYKSVNLLTFFNEYIGANQMTIISGGETYLFNNFLFWTPILVIVLSLIVSVLMFNKNKPLIYYFSLIIFYLLLFVFFVFTKEQVRILGNELIDIRILKIIRDILAFCVSAEVLFVMISLVRGIGFDVKKFNFKDDLEDLDINEEDREEIEVAINFDVEEEKARIRKNIRLFKYRMVENKSLLSLISILAIVIITIICISMYFNKEKIYKVGEVINPSYFSFKLNNVYLTQKNYEGNYVDGDKYFVILDTNIKKITTAKYKLEKARMSIVSKGYSIYPTYAYSGSFKDIGFEYKDNDLSDEFNRYLLVYEVPKQFLDDELYFKYYDINESTYKYKLDYINLDLIKNTKTIKLNEKINFKDTLLGNTNLKISNIEFNDVFKINYNICLTKEECYMGYELIYPDLSSNYDRTLIKLSGKLELDETYYKKISLVNFIDYFGNIFYEIDGKRYKADLNHIKTEKVATSSVFFSVNKNILNASSIELEIKVRDYVYTYKIK